MGKAERNRRESAREKIAAQQAAARKAENRKRALLAGGTVFLVIAIVAVFLVVKTAGSPAKATATRATQPATVVKQVTSVPDTALGSVGIGSTYQNAVQTIKDSTAVATQNGKPLITYVGAEYCPYCAAERWALTVALSKFGTFRNLGFIHSAPAPEVDPSTPTLTFYKSSYTSNYIVFDPTEAQTVTHATLEKTTKQQNDLMAKYDAPPYVPSSSYDGSFPFVDFANKYVINGASYDPAVLKGLTWAQVAAALKDPGSPVAKGVDGAANLITAAICKATGGKPGNVCTSAGVTKANGAI
jgi:thiol-disulfide isomerase/thioredoxin